MRDALKEMHQYFSRGYTPKARRSKACNACSLKEECLPGLERSGKVSDYLRRGMEDEV